MILKRRMITDMKMNIKMMARTTILAALAALCMSISVFAAQFSVTPAAGVLYTNENTIIFTDADEKAVLLPEVAADLPIQVTGITSNGYFQILLNGQTLYVNGIGLAATTKADAAAIQMANQTKEIYDRMIAQKAVFPEGMRWTNDNYYRWKGIPNSIGYGCAGFAFAVSDAAFGDKPVIVHYDYNNIKVGDILRVNNDTHSVIVLEVKPTSVIVAEGNYNSSIHWGREIAKSKLQDPYSYIMTRY